MCRHSQNSLKVGVGVVVADFQIHFRSLVRPLSFIVLLAIDSEIGAAYQNPAYSALLAIAAARLSARMLLRIVTE